jgi:CubicO group peptidase (beta-lactamase class C family)
VRRSAIAAVLVVVALALEAPASGASAGGARHCPLPGAGGPIERATPEQVGLDPRAVNRAIAYASSHDRLSVRIYRFNCLVATGPLDPATERIPWNVFSSTKSVISLLAGIAWGEGKLGLDDPIGKYLPAGMGDAAHRAITIRDLLTETAGLKQSILSEFFTVGNDPNVAAEAMALPLEHEPGTYFNYTQRVPDLLAYVVQRAVGEDLQSFAQRKLFGPIGIARDDYFWLRDRSGDTYGYANLFIPPVDFARLGLLMDDGGRWRGRRIVPAAYVRKLRRPSATNPCYGFLFWVNRRSPCVTASIPSRRVLDRRLVPSAPRDMFAMIGAFQQNDFMLPRLGIVVSWTGLGGDASADPQAILSADPGADLYYNTFRNLLKGVAAYRYRDPGPYRADSPNWDFDPDQFLDPNILIGGLGFGPYAPPDCTVLACGGADLSAGPRRELEDIVDAVLGAAGGW